MYEKAQQQQDEAQASSDGADGSVDAEAEEEVVDAEVVDESK